MGGHSSTTVTTTNHVKENVNNDQQTIENYVHNYDIKNNDHHYNEGVVVKGDKVMISNYLNAGQQCFGGACGLLVLL